jgi:hypothetical protein
MMSYTAAHGTKRTSMADALLDPTSLFDKNSSPGQDTFDNADTSTKRRCCEQECEGYWTVASDLKARRDRVHHPDLKPAVKQLLLKRIWETELVIPGTNRKVCGAAAARILAVPRRRLYYKSVDQAKFHQKGALSRVIQAWWMDYILMLDKMPDDDSYQIAKPTRKAVWQCYDDDRKKWPDCFEACSPSYFNAVWMKLYPKVRLRRHMRFSKCVDCVNQRRIKNDRSLSRDERDAAHKELLDHYEYIKTARAIIEWKKQKSLTRPQDFCYVSQDGTNALPFGYPHFAETTKDERKERMDTKLMISYVHGIGTWTYTIHADVTGDPNLNIECLQRTLKHVENKNGFLAKTLFLQLDNCFRENKNSYVMAYLAWLVERGVFDRVELSFLPVGHTHNECDQVGFTAAFFSLFFLF